MNMNGLFPKVHPILYFILLTCQQLVLSSKFWDKDLAALNLKLVNMSDKSFENHTQVSLNEVIEKQNEDVLIQWKERFVQGLDYVSEIFEFAWFRVLCLLLVAVFIVLIVRRIVSTLFSPPQTYGRRKYYSEVSSC